MNFAASSHRPSESSSGSQHNRPSANPDLSRLFVSAFSVLEQPPPPSLREILNAYRAKGDGDREMLVTMLNAKSAEDQRIASIATLHRTVLEVYQANVVDARQNQDPPLHGVNVTHSYPTLPHPHSPSFYEQKNSWRSSAHRRTTSRSRSPPGSHAVIPPIRDAPRPNLGAEQPRKRPRISQLSSHVMYESHTGSHRDHLPPSPYSSSGRSDSAEYSPRSRASMAIGSLLSSRPSHVVNRDVNGHE
ncbi:hypothetical protein AX17_000075 [Amanita inopinata Kibby_2008]|nr:hypothetical protein AX17_000075 [Amanita inopinata Kibby_2008]